MRCDLVAQARCDTDKSCLGNALTLQTPLPTAARPNPQRQYADVRKTASQNTLTTALTFECWLNPEREPGVRQFVAGLWGPNTDANDVWVLYINANDELVFEVNGSGTSLGSLDNTIARTSIAARYNSWFHVAVVFDGASQTARLFVNGVEASSNRNAQYPASRLRTLQTPDLALQIGSANALSNVGERNVTFRGQLDEIRLWSRALLQNEILCGLYNSREGNEAGLVLYYRANEPRSSTTLCDATNNGNTADLRSGARADAPTVNRAIPQVLSVNPPAFAEDFRCETTRTYRMRVQNTSPSCAERVAITLSGESAAQFSVNPSRLTLAAGAESEVVITLRTNIAGIINAEAVVARENRCSDTVRVPLRIMRTTNVQPSLQVVTFGTLYAGCREVPFLPRSFTLRNTGTVPVRLLGVSNNRRSTFRVIGNGNASIPAQGSEPFTVQFSAATAADSAGLAADTLRIRTDDACQPEIVVPLAGEIREAVIVRRGYGFARLDSVVFGRECPAGGITDPFDFTWESAAATASAMPQAVRIDTVIYPPFIRGKSQRYPILLTPGMFTEPNFLRFAPLEEGAVRDSVIIRASVPSGGSSVGNCTFEKKIYVSGRGNAIVTRITPAVVNVGNVIVGQQGVRMAMVTNPSPSDTLRVSVYLKRGEVFSLAGAGFTLLPGRTVQVPITFRPNTDSLYTDSLCVSEQRCFFTTCATVQGRGILQTFAFDSTVTRIENVLGCDFRLDTITIRNLSSTPQILTNIAFDDASSGKIEVLSGLAAATVVSTTIPANGQLQVTVRYTPNDLMRDRADGAFIRFQAAGQNWTLTVRASSVVPRLGITSVAAFGVVEVGGTKLDTLQVENLSTIPVRLDSVSVPDGYRIIWLERTLPALLPPRAVVRVGVEFAPKEARRYNGIMRAASSLPCPAHVTGQLQGTGQIIQLDPPDGAPSFGFTRTCECSERVVTLKNPSFVNPVSIESIITDSAFATPGTGAPQFFSWSSQFSPTGRTPYQIPPNVADTIRIRFCPRSPAEDRFATSQARIVIQARGVAWRDSLEIFLFGKRTFTFRPSALQVNFNPTLVNIESAPLPVDLAIPGIVQNPTPEAVVIDSIGFQSADGLASSAAAFRVIAPAARPIQLLPNTPVRLQIAFRPTASRPYAARMILYTSQPCRDIDTTILITGTGFVDSPPGVQVFFNSALQSRLDTFRVTTCAVVQLPIFAQRTTPDSVNTALRLTFDTTQVRVVRVLSDIAPQSQVLVRSTRGGVEIRALGIRLDSLRALFRVEFASVTGRRALVPVLLDSLAFTTPFGGPSRYIGAGASAVSRIVVQQTRIDALVGGIISSQRTPLLAQFDSVQVLDCAERTFSVRNTGDVPVRAWSLVNVPPDVRIVKSIPALTDSVLVGQNLELTVQFCPRTARRIDTTFGVQSSSPCETTTLATLTGRGFVPDFPLTISFTSNSLTATIGDTLTLPLVLNRDLATTLRGAQYWLRALRFSVNVDFSPYSLKFLDAQTSTTLRASSGSTVLPKLTATQSSFGKLSLDFAGLDSVRAGTLAELRFLVTVPDTLVSFVNVSSNAASWRSDSLLFLGVRPISTISTFTTIGACNITFLQYPSRGTLLAGRVGELLTNVPNPASERTNVEFELLETVPVKLAVYDARGNAVLTLLDGSQVLRGGRYTVEMDVRSLAQGVYFVVVEGGIFRAAKPMMIVR
jgi:Concanavalin A-like lectin/glucanases superfamily